MKHPAQKTWRDLVDDVIQKLPRDFTLDDVRRYEGRLAAEYPQNRNIDAKIRQTLQILRDQGVLEFLGGGRYRRLQTAPVIS
jgi:type II restriction enzyme